MQSNKEIVIKREIQYRECWDYSNSNDVSISYPPNFPFIYSNPTIHIKSWSYSETIPSYSKTIPIECIAIKQNLSVPWEYIETSNNNK